MRRQWIIVWIVVLGVLAGLVLLIGVNMIGRYTGLTVPRLEPETVERMLEPHYRITRPEGEGPFPTALLLSGCDGPRDNMETWAAALAARGWASVVVDSHTPRGFTELQLWRLICAGQLLTGAERAGDIAVALDHVRGLPFVDPERLALMGASHGGWAILEFLVFADRKEVPFALERWPDGAGSGLPDGPLAGVAAAVLFYPYCGEFSRANRWGWSGAVPVLFLLAEGDAIADETDCLEIVRREGRQGQPVAVHVYAGVTHGFDQQDKAPLSITKYDAATTADAMARAGAFLDGAIGR